MTEHGEQRDYLRAILDQVGRIEAEHGAKLDRLLEIAQGQAGARLGC